MNDPTHQSNEVLYLRLCRVATNSWITFKLDHLVEFEVASDFVETMLPGWELTFGSPTNPDKNTDELDVW